MCNLVWVCLFLINVRLVLLIGSVDEKALLSVYSSSLQEILFRSLQRTAGCTLVWAGLSRASVSATFLLEFPCSNQSALLARFVEQLSPPINYSLPLAYSSATWYASLCAHMSITASHGVSSLVWVLSFRYPLDSVFLLSQSHRDGLPAGMNRNVPADRYRG